MSLMTKHDTKKKKQGTTCGTRNVTLGPTLVAKGKSGINSCTKKREEGKISVKVSTKGGEGWDKNIINMGQIDPEGWGKAPIKKEKKNT